MKVEGQVCSLELSKQLNKLGVPQTAYFKYSEFERGYIISISEAYIYDYLHLGDSVVFDPEANQEDFGEHVENHSAFTVCELGEFMLGNLNLDGNYYCLSYGNIKNYHFADLLRVMRVDKQLHGTIGDTEADARAKMLIWLIENKNFKPN